MRKALLFLSLTPFITAVHSQETESMKQTDHSEALQQISLDESAEKQKPGKRFRLNPWENINGYRFAIGYYRDFEAEAAYLLTSFPEKDPGFGGMAMLVQYIGGGIEYIKDGPYHAVGPKLSYEANFSILSAQMGAGYLYAEHGEQFRLMPKVGLSMFGVVTVYYGYNFNLNKSSALQPCTHVFSLQVNLYDFFLKE